MIAVAQSVRTTKDMRRLMRVANNQASAKTMRTPAAATTALNGKRRCGNTSMMRYQGKSNRIESAAGPRIRWSRRATEAG